MAQDMDKVKDAYDSIAQEYAEAFSGEHDKKPKDRKMLRRFARELGGRGPVWDLGCGPGQTAGFLRNLGVEISGLDLSEKLLAHARAAHPGIPFQQGNILHLALESGSAAGIVSFYAIVHFTREQAQQALAEMFRVLRPGGLLLLAFHAGSETLHITEFLGKAVEMDFMLFESAYVSGCLKETGFEGIEIVLREPYPGVEYPSRRAYVFARKPGG
ncbi:MAG: methyltransferase domain-containing protein [Thermodesulfobacteriota bacterium]